VHGFLPDQAVQADGPGASNTQVEKDEAVKHRQFPAVEDGPEPLRWVAPKVGHGHLTAEKERQRPGKQAQEYKQNAKALENSCLSDQRSGSRRRAVTAQPSKSAEQLLEAMQWESESRDDAQHR
jgi:hypothetical protein